MNGQAEQHWICRLTNQPHQFSYESGVEVTHVEPGRAEGVLTVGPDSINPQRSTAGRWPLWRIRWRAAVPAPAGAAA